MNIFHRIKTPHQIDNFRHPFIRERFRREFPEFRFHVVPGGKQDIRNVLFDTVLRSVLQMYFDPRYLPALLADDFDFLGQIRNLRVIIVVIEEIGIWPFLSIEK